MLCSRNELRVAGCAQFITHLFTYLNTQNLRGTKWYASVHGGYCKGPRVHKRVGFCAQDELRKACCAQIGLLLCTKRAAEGWLYTIHYAFVHGACFEGPAVRFRSGPAGRVSQVRCIFFLPTLQRIGSTRCSGCKVVNEKRRNGQKR